MYKVTVQTNGVTYPLFISGIADLILIKPVLITEIGLAGNFSFSIAKSHPYYDKIHPLSSEIYVYHNEEELFRGRYIGREDDFFRTGKVTCEGELAYLLDSQQRPYEHQGSIPDFLRARLASHNSQVEIRKRYNMGQVTVIDNNNYINRSNSDYSNTLECLREKLVQTHGGYLRTRHENGIRYLDYVTDYGGINSQPIRFGENLLDITHHVNPTTIITALIPIGASVEITKSDGTIDNARINVTSVNNGSDYIYNADAVARYGWIFGVHKWDDVTLPENLLTKAQAYLDECINLPAVFELTAVDLSLIKMDVDSLKVGFWTQVISGPHEISGMYLLTKKEIHLTEPEKDKIVLGGTIPSLSGSIAKNQVDLSLRVQQVAESASREINAKVENATQLITGGLGGYIVIGRAKDGHPEEILIMDAPTKDAAKNVIRLNKNGFGFSTSGYNGIYRNAWTIDGNLVADFVTTGTMLADRIRGGTLEIGGSGLGKDGYIVVRAANNTLIATLSKDGLNVYSGTIQGARIIGASIEGGTITGNTISGGNISGTTISGGNIRGTRIEGGEIKGSSIESNNAKITGGQIKIDTGSNSMDAISLSSGGGSHAINVQPGAVYCKINGNESEMSGGSIYASDGFYGELKSSSDRRKKEKIIPILPEDARGILCRLQPCIYQYKKDVQKKQHFGLIAQEVKAVLDVLGYSNTAIVGHQKRSGRNEMYIQYQEMIALLLVAVQDLYERIGGDN